MSFASMSAWQALLLMAGAGLAAWALFRMKVRPPKIQVPTLLLWRRVFDQVREMTWWERVRRVVSMAATILIAVVLALAVTRPGPSTGATTQGRTLIVLDSSW
jgi:F0F1-type ATP synthase membrane subunit a